MFGSFKRAMGIVTAHEEKGYITLDGIPNDVIQRDIQKIWRTSRVGKHMFTRTTRNTIIFPSFFALEVKFMLTQILAADITLTSRRSINAIFSALDEFTWIGKIDSDLNRGFDYSKLNQINVSLLPHQLEFIRKYERNTIQYGLNGYYLAAAPGSGKTLNGLALGLLINPDVQIYICPKNAVEEVWVENIERFFKKQPKLWHSLSGKPVDLNAEYFICHYEQLAALEPLFKKIKNKKVYIDIDEGHNFNDIKSARTKRLIEYCASVANRDVLWASGTPLKSIGSEVIPFLTTIDPSFRPMVAERFKKIFGMSTGVAGNILSHRMGEVTYKVDKGTIRDGEGPLVEEIKIQIPNGQDYTLDTIRKEMVKFIEERIKYYKANRDEYHGTYARIMEAHKATVDEGTDRNYSKYIKSVKELQKLKDYRNVPEVMEYTNWYEKEVIIPTLSNEDKKLFRSAKSVVKYVELKIRGEALGRILGRRRAQCHVDMVPYAGLMDIIEDSNSKTLIFTSFTEVVEETQAFLKYNKEPSLVVYGKTNKDLKAIVSQFARDDKIRALAATLQSLSTAVPMIMASSVVFMNAPFRIHEYEQAVARADRIGQKHRVKVYKIALDTGEQANVSTRSSEIMEWSKQQVDMIMGSAGLESYTGPFDESQQILHSYGLEFEEGLFAGINTLLHDVFDFGGPEPAHKEYYS